LDRRGAVVGGPEAPFTLPTVPYVDAFCMHERGRKATHVAVRRRPAMYVTVSRHTSTQDTADAKIICYLPLFITSPAQRNDGRQRNVRRRSVCDCCRRNRLQRRRFSPVTNIVAVTWMPGCVVGVRAAASSWKPRSLAVAWMDGRSPDAQPGGVDGALL